MLSLSRSTANLFAVLAGAMFIASAILSPRLASADEGPAAASPPVEPSSRVTQEWLGLELTPLSLALTGTPCCRPGASLSPVQAGLGGSLRLLRHRWKRAYVIPVEAGIYLGETGRRTAYIHVQAEGGLVVPGTDRRLELGLGAGAGILGMEYANGCDGACDIGGAGALLSLVARYLFIDGPHFTVGASARAVFPLNRTRGEYFGHLTGWGDILLASVEAGYGR